MKTTIRFSFFSLCILCMLALAGCQPVQKQADTPGATQDATQEATTGAAPDAMSDAIYQVSLLDGLMQGDYDGTATVGQLLQEGNTGLGTFDKLDGEMIVLDGVVYKAKSDGSVEVASDSQTVPFAAVTNFDEDIAAVPLSPITDFAGLKVALDDIIAKQTGDFNRFYVAEIKGNFDVVHVRSVPMQSKPYQPLAEVTKNQAEFEYENIPGTAVAMRFPDYMQGINLPGWHLHFLSDDKTKGGHVLDLKLADGTVSMDTVLAFQLVAPGTESFANLDLGADLSQQTTTVESK